MEIILKQEDADFIANVTRKRLEDLEEAYKIGIEECNHKHDLVKDLVNLIPESDRDKVVSDEDIEEINNMKEKAIYKMNEKYQEEKSTLYRILELAVCGS